MKRIVEWKIRKLGHFCPHRSLRSDHAVPFRSSETISSVMGDLLMAEDFIDVQPGCEVVRFLCVRLSLGRVAGGGTVGPPPPLSTARPLAS